MQALPKSSPLKNPQIIGQTARTVAGIMTLLRAARRASRARTRYPRPKSGSSTARRRARRLKVGQRYRISALARTKKKYKRKFRRINVKADVDGYSQTKTGRKVSRKQKRKVAKRFKNGYQMYQRNVIDVWQDTTPQNFNTAKWIWRTYSTARDISWGINRSNGIATEGPNTTITTSQSTNYNNPAQETYFGKDKVRYEIFNPCNYDVHLVIYDVVCKADTPGNAHNNEFVWNYQDPQLALYDPISCIQKGTYSRATSTGGATPAGVALGDDTSLDIKDISIRPTQSYNFNCFWRIVGKKTIKLQPGAIHIHEFSYNMHSMISRGFLYQRYFDHFYANTGSADAALAKITHGTLFKYWGQVAGDNLSSFSLANAGNITMNNYKAVVNLSGRLVIKLEGKQNFYHMDDKTKYIFKDDRNTYGRNTAGVATIDEEERFQIVTDTNVCRPNDEPEPHLVEVMNEDESNDPDADEDN